MNSTNNNSFEIAAIKVFSDLYALIKEDENMTLKDDKPKPIKSNKLDLNNCTIAVVRLGRDGTLKNSRPCNHCLDSMKFYRIKKIMYSTDDGTIKTEKPENMEQVHISSGWSAFENPQRLKGTKVI